MLYTDDFAMHDLAAGGWRVWSGALCCVGLLAVQEQLCLARHLCDWVQCVHGQRLHSMCCTACAAPCHAPCCTMRCTMPCTPVRREEACEPRAEPCPGADATVTSCVSEHSLASMSMHTLFAPCCSLLGHTGGYPLPFNAPQPSSAAGNRPPPAPASALRSVRQVLRAHARAGRPPPRQHCFAPARALHLCVQPQVPAR